MAAEVQRSIIWAPQPGPQKALVDCPYREIGLGGARGGGKTDGVLGKWGIKGQLYKQHFNAVFFRKEMPQQDDLIERAKELYLPCEAEWYDQKKTFRLKGGGRIRFRPLESIQDAEKYQGQSLTDAAVEEAGNYPDAAPIDRLFGCLRSAAGVPTQLITTFNPGGPGHSWLKERYWDPAPHGMVPLFRKLPNGKEHRYVFIPSRVTNNKILLAKDPNYVDNLYLVGSPELVRAWLEGDFEIHEGSYFPEFGQRHIVSPFEIPKHWHRYIGADWGYHSPGCVVFGAISSGKTDEGTEVPYPKGSIIIYREWKFKGLDNHEIGKHLAELCEGEEFTKAVIDPSTFNHQGGKSIADQIKEGGFAFREADNDRISGWSQIRLRLKPDPAMIYLLSSCPYLIKTLPALPMDPRNAEDLDTTADDHGADALRYLCKERTLESDYLKPKQESKLGIVHVSDYIERVRRERERPRI